MVRLPRGARNRMNIFERFQMTMAFLLGGRERDDKGAAMVEYGILVAGVAVIVAAAIVVLGPKITAVISSI